MKVTCCQCSVEYPLEIKKQGKTTFIECPGCGMQHVVDFIPLVKPLIHNPKTVPEKEFKFFDGPSLALGEFKFFKCDDLHLKDYYMSHDNSRYANSDAADQQTADNSDITGWSVSATFILATRIYNNSGKDTEQQDLTLQWRSAVGGYLSISDTGEAKYTAGTVLVNDAIVSIVSRYTDAKGGFAWVDGLQVEDGVCVLNVNNGEYSEIQWGVSTVDGSEGEAFEFRVIDTSDAIVVGLVPGTIALESGDKTVVVTDSGAGTEEIDNTHEAIDSGTGTEDTPIIVVTSVVAVDSGSGSEDVARIHYVTDSGTGTDAPTGFPSAAIAVEDSGTGTDDAERPVEWQDTEDNVWIDADDVWMPHGEDIVSVKSTTDSGAGTDVIAVSQSAIVIADSGAGTEAAPIISATSIIIADSGTGVENIDRIHVVEDSGVGTESIAASQSAVIVADSGAGTENVPIAVASVVVTDSGAGIEEVSRAHEVLDSGTGSEEIDVPFRTVFDSGTGSEATPVIQVGSVIVADSGAGSEDVVKTIEGGVVKEVTDSGAGTEATPVIQVADAVVDSGDGTEVIPIAVVSIILADSGTGTEDVPVVEIDAAVTDSAVGSEAIPVVAAGVVVADSGAGTEGITSAGDQTKIVTDSAAGADVVDTIKPVTAEEAEAERLRLQYGATTYDEARWPRRVPEPVTVVYHYVGGGNLGSITGSAVAGLLPVLKRKHVESRVGLSGVQGNVPGYLMSELRPVLGIVSLGGLTGKADCRCFSQLERDDDDLLSIILLEAA